MAEELEPGRTLGRYELLLPIATGGMATVWAARLKGKRRFQKIVAIKCLLPDFSEDETFERMFMSEAELASRIRHPNVCEILDLGEDEGSLYIVMEWIDGDPLYMLRREAKAYGGIPISIAGRIAASVASGLHAAHELRGDDGKLVGVVHRDVSPQNIMVTPHGEVKIVDFGVAKATAAADTEHTRAGQIKGKVPFMAPEQALGRPVDRRTDVFSLGICLFQMVTGKHPFKQKDDLSTLRRICDKSPVSPPSSVSDSVPLALEEAIVKALEKDPERRFQDMDEFRRAIEAALANVPSHNAEDDDIGAFVTKVLGYRAAERRDALRAAQQASGETPGLSSSSTTEPESPTSPSDKASSSDASSAAPLRRKTPPVGTLMTDRPKIKRTMTPTHGTPSMAPELTPAPRPTDTPMPGVLGELSHLSEQAGGGVDRDKSPTVRPKGKSAHDATNGESSEGAALNGSPEVEPPSDAAARGAATAPQRAGRELELESDYSFTPPKSSNRGAIVAFAVMVLIVVAGFFVIRAAQPDAGDTVVPLENSK